MLESDVAAEDRFVDSVPSAVSEFGIPMLSGQSSVAADRWFWGSLRIVAAAQG